MKEIIGNTKYCGHNYDIVAYDHFGEFGICLEREWEPGEKQDGFPIKIIDAGEYYNSNCHCGNVEVLKEYVNENFGSLKEKIRYLKLEKNRHKYYKQTGKELLEQYIFNEEETIHEKINYNELTKKAKRIIKLNSIDWFECEANSVWYEVYEYFKELKEKNNE
ncbi:MAG: hypothetical protein IKE69_11685 [Thermoguttaceae bacterium]|nr:hypothetical protein [Thermoguttaceae bacterium]